MPGDLVLSLALLLVANYWCPACLLVSCLHTKLAFSLSRGTLFRPPLNPLSVSEDDLTNLLHVVLHMTS